MEVGKMDEFLIQHFDKISDFNREEIISIMDP
jgi:hypothetical protein